MGISTGVRSLEIIIPVFNEAPMLPALLNRFQDVFQADRLRDAGLSEVRFLFIDDGSSDNTAEILAERIRSGWSALLIRLTRNFGHQPALTAGLDYARADLVAIMDADLQDPPELILDMVTKIDQGYEVVYGQRRARQESWYKKALYWSFYRLYSFLSDVPVPIDAGDFCLMKQPVVEALRRLPEKLRFHRGLRSWVGFRQVGLPYDRPGRQAGSSKYTIAKLYALATNGIASLSIRPLRITQVVLFFSIFLTLGSLSLSWFYLFRSSVVDSHLIWFLTTQILIAFTSSLQIFCLYILGAYIGRMYLEVKSRPGYIVLETVGHLPTTPHP